MTLGPLMIDVAGCHLSVQERQWLASPLVGGVILFSRNWSEAGQLRDLVAEIHGLRQPALLVAVDQEGGRVQRFRTASRACRRRAGLATSTTWTRPVAGSWRAPGAG